MDTTTVACMPRAARGRPRLIGENERRARVIEAAERVFVSYGYSESSVDMIAKHAGMSKKTLYQLFDTKQALFAAVIAARREALKEMIQSECCGKETEPGVILRRFLLQVARFALAHRQSDLYRLVIAESRRAPELACAFYQEGPSKARLSLMEWLTEQHRAGTLVVPNPEMTASMLCSMVIAEPQMRILIGDLRQVEDAAIGARVDAAVRLFLEGAIPR